MAADGSKQIPVATLPQVTLNQLIDYVMANTEDVGKGFAEEARKIASLPHYHAALGHDFPGYRLLQIAGRLGVCNATHNNTRGHMTRLLERELVARIKAVLRRIEPAALAFLEGCGLRVRKESDRQLSAGISGLPGVIVFMQRARDIVTQVTDVVGDFVRDNQQ